MMKRRIVLRSVAWVILCLTVLSFGTPVFAAEQAVSEAKTVQKAALKAGQGEEYETLLTVKKGTKVTVLDALSNADWVRVITGGKEGFLTRKSLDLPAYQPPAEEGAAAPATVPTASADGLAAKIAEARKINADTVGWVQVPNTNIDDAILYAPNFYYANRDIHKKKSSDSVYPYTNKKTKNIVVFGHNLRGSNNCFHQLHHLEEAARGVTKCQHAKCGRSISDLAGWQQTKEGRTFNISIFGLQKWEVFAMYEVKKDESIQTLRNNWALNPSNMDKWIAGQMERSKSYMGFDFDVGVSGKDQILTLITCGTEYDSATANSRLFVFLKNVD